MRLRSALAIVIVILCMRLAAAQTSGSKPTLNTPVNGASVLLGSTAPGTAPITIYDISFPVRTKIGAVSDLANDGKFSCAVKPPLVLGHQIIAVDKNGNASAPLTVVATNPNPAPAPQ
jgi:hypothetical protein